jgi:nucleoside phosphorylase
MVDGVEADRPTGARVAQRLRKLRADRQLTLTQLAERLAGLGHPLQLSVISKIENGQRRVDVDDVVAFALALEVSPNQILLTEGARAASTVQLTPGRALTEKQAWAWASQVNPAGKLERDHGGLVVILVALDVEYEAIRRLLGEIKAVAHPSGTRFEVGVARGTTRQVAIAVAGSGNYSAAVLAERAITMFRPSAILFVGIAGSFAAEVSPGDVVVGTRVDEYPGGFAGDGPAARPRVLTASHDLEQLARHVARQERWPDLLADGPPEQPLNVHFGPIASGEAVLHAREAPQVNELRRHYRDAVAIEMESGGPQAAQLNLLPAITIRGISDRVDGEKRDAGGPNWQLVAAGRAAAFAVTLVAEMPDRTT